MFSVQAGGSLLDPPGESTFRSLLDPTEATAGHALAPAEATKGSLVDPTFVPTFAPSSFASNSEVDDANEEVEGEGGKAKQQ